MAISYNILWHLHCRIFTVSMMGIWRLVEMWYSIDVDPMISFWSDTSHLDLGKLEVHIYQLLPKSWLLINVENIVSEPSEMDPEEKMEWDSPFSPIELPLHKNVFQFEEDNGLLQHNNILSLLMVTRHATWWYGVRTCGVKLHAPMLEAISI